MTLSQRWSSSLCYPRRQERELHAILLFLLRRPQPFTRVLDRHYLASFAYHIWSACNIYYFKVINRNQNTGNNEVNAIKSSTRNLENHLPGIFREKKKKKNTEKARVHPCEMSLSKLLIKPGSLVVMLLGPSDTLIVDYDYKACSKEKSFIQHSN